jgi:DNA-binding response OmpR family regulator
MERKRILMAIRSPRDFHELRSSLVTAGYEVRVVPDGEAAITLTQEFRPHLVLSEIELPKIDGHHLLRELKSYSYTSQIPFVLVSHHRSVEERVRSIDLGVDEYITTPFDVKEVLLRMAIVLQEIEQFENSGKCRRKGFIGKLSEINLVELLQILDISRKSGLIKIQNERDDEGVILFREGELLNASLANLRGEAAVRRMFCWTEGTFQVELRGVSSQKAIKSSTNDLAHEGLIIGDRWRKWTGYLPPLHTRVQAGPNFDQAQLQEYERTFIKQIHERATLIDMIEDSPYDDLKALEMVAKMFRRRKIEKDELQHETEDSAGLPQMDHNGRPNASRLVTKFFDKNVSMANRTNADRRQEQRRQTNRRIRNRREVDYSGQSSDGALNKSELIMIREKLTNGVGTRTGPDNENR